MRTFSFLELLVLFKYVIFFFQAEDGIRDYKVTGVQTCALPICVRPLRQVGLPRAAGGGATCRALGPPARRKRSQAGLRPAPHVRRSAARTLARLVRDRKSVV